MKGNTVFVTLVLVVMSVSEIEMIPEAMKQLTGGFLKVLDHCKNELNLTDGVLGDLFHLWKEEYDLVGRDAGCLVSCMSKKLDLLDEDGKIHHGNTREYVTKNGVGEDIATQLISIVHNCEKDMSTADECDRMLQIMKCFRTNMKQVQWTPKMETVITELISDV